MTIMNNFPAWGGRIYAGRIYGLVDDCIYTGADGAIHEGKPASGDISIISNTLIYLTVNSSSTLSGGKVETIADGITNNGKHYYLFNALENNFEIDMAYGI